MKERATAGVDAQNTGASVREDPSELPRDGLVHEDQRRFSSSTVLPENPKCLGGSWVPHTVAHRESVSAMFSSLLGVNGLLKEARHTRSHVMNTASATRNGSVVMKREPCEGTV